MLKNTILRIALPTPLRRLFDYLAPQGLDISTLTPGVRVLVPFQKRKLVGILIEVTDISSVPYHKLKTITEILDKTPLIKPDVLKLCFWAADYYHHALGEVLQHAYPSLLKKKRKAELPAAARNDKLGGGKKALPVLNSHQAQAVESITACEQFKVFALDGVTGSGKTEVYLRAIEQLIKKNRQALVLVPEISLTPQTLARFTERFNVLVVSLHSALSDKERYKAWEAARSGEAGILIGTRSAIFTPMANLGMIVVDEEHDLSFKQQDRFRYHARDLAIMRAQYNRIPVVLGSATLSLETLHNVSRKRYQCLSLPERAANAVLPKFELLDLRKNVQLEEGLAASLREKIQQVLAHDNQVMLFLNKRGFAPVLYCAQCGWLSDCEHCSARMVYHQKPRALHCHYCDARKRLPDKCPRCSYIQLMPVGLGTQRIEAYLAKQFPDVPIIRVDRDTTRKKGSLHGILNDIHAEGKAILLGTQMLAKGHHFPNVTLVGIIDADSGLFSADFRSAEQMGQLLLQVAGRAGRAEKEGLVVVQTHNPENPLLKCLLEEGYASFTNLLLQERKAVALPPYTFFALLRAEARNQAMAENFLAQLKQRHHLLQKDVQLLGPIPALIAKRKGYFCQNLLIKSQKRSSLHAFLKQLIVDLDRRVDSKVRWVVDVDPVSV